MKSLLLVGLIAAGVPAAAEQVSETREFIALAAKLERVDGSNVGIAGLPGRFSLLARYASNWLVEDEMLSMLRHEKPIVRLLGYQSMLLQAMKVPEADETRILEDPTVVPYCPIGRVENGSEIGAIAKALKKEPTLLIEGSPKFKLSLTELSPVLSMLPTEPADGATFMERAEALTQVDGSAVGYGGTPGAFSLLVKEGRRSLDAGQLRVLLKHEKPIVRLLAFQLMLLNEVPIALEDANRVMHDKSPVLFFPYGCSGFHVTIGDIAAKLALEPKMLVQRPKSQGG